MMTKSKRHKGKPKKTGDHQDPAGNGDLATPTLEVVSEQVAAFIENLESERDDAVEGRKRALADFANFQKRALENEKRAHNAGGGQMVRLLLPMLDHFDLALNQDISRMTGEQLIDGLKMVRNELLKALESGGVGRIEPQVGEPFDPNIHEAVMRLEQEGVAPDHIAQLLQPGFTLGETVLRPAKVAVAPPEEKPNEESEDSPAVAPEDALEEYQEEVAEEVWEEIQKKNADKDETMENSDAESSPGEDADTRDRYDSE